jgi:hypothetical protein
MRCSRGSVRVFYARREPGGMTAFLPLVDIPPEWRYCQQPLGLSADTWQVEQIRAQFAGTPIIGQLVPAPQSA